MIAIITKLDQAVGGREYKTEYGVSPENLLRAIGELEGVARTADAWLEIDGHRIERSSFPTTLAGSADLIKRVKSGDYHRTQERLAEFWLEMREIAARERDAEGRVSDEIRG